MTPAEFEHTTRAAAAQVGHLTEAGAKQAIALLQQMRDTLVVRLAQAPTAYSDWFFTQLLRETNQLFTTLQTQYTEQLGATLADVAETVERAVDQPVRSAGLTIDLPRLSRQTVKFLTDSHPGERIQRLTNDGRQIVQNVLRQGLLGVKTPWEVQQIIAQNLADPGPFHSIKTRAETIWATEANRTFNILSQERYDQINDLTPGKYQKQWMHSGSPHPRPHHLELDGETIAIDAEFQVGGYSVDGPHDKRLPASEVVNCGCTTFLVFA